MIQIKYLPDLCENLDFRRKPITEKDRVEGEIPYYGASGVVDYVDGYIFDEELLLVSEDGANLLARSTPIAFSIKGKTWVNNHAHVLKFSNKLIQKYVELYLNSISLEPYVTGSAQPKLNQKRLNEIPIPLPELNIMSNIIEAISQINELIALRKEQLAKLDQLVKSRFIELFGDPNTNPMKWKKEQLQINTTLLNGRAYKQDELLDDGKYPVLRVGNFFSNRGWYYSDLELDEDKYCDDGDLLYAWSASFGPRIWNGGKVIYHYHIWKVLVGEKYNKQFLCHLLDYATASFMGDTHGIGMMHLTKSGMEETEFIVPPIDLQNQFTAFVEQTDKSKLAIQQSLDKLELLKKSLMQEYFG